MKFSEKKDILWQRLIGKPSEFSLEGRIFHSICIIGLLILAYHVPFNYLIGLHVVAWISLLMLILLSYAYYLSRVQHKLRTSIVMFGLLSNLMLAAVYFFNSGSLGPCLLLFALLIYLTIAIVPKEQYKIWIPFNIIVVLILFAMEYLHPEWIIDTYDNIENRFIDYTSAYIVVVILIYYSVKYVRHHYDYEKKSAEDRAIAIEKQNLQILDQNSQLARLNIEKNKLFSIVAHDLRTPLGSIQGYLELLSEVSLEEAEKQRIEKELLDITMNTSDMLSNLLSWSKAQMDGVTVRPVVFNLYEVLHKTLENEKTIALNKGIRFDYHIDKTIQLKADIDMMQLIVRNLVSNATKFTNVGGQIRVSTELNGDHCKLTIKDTGTGISYDQQDMVFSLEAKSTFGTRNEKGVGLGLLLCKEFTELQGGTIDFESIPGEGAAFYILMPLA